MNKGTTQAPNPFQVAQAQTASNKETAIANSVLGNANVNGPTGSTRFDIAGEYAGVPRWTQTNTLSPNQQQLFERQETLGGMMGDAALDQTSRIRNTLASPLTTEGLPAGGQLSNAMPLRTGVGPTDYSQDRTNVENAIYSRLNPQLDRDRSALENRLINQGMARGSQGFTDAMDESNRQANDARMQAVLAGGQEQTRLADLAFRAGEFENNALGGMFDMGMRQATAMDTQRERALQERAYMRNQPISETNALMSGAQPQTPQFTQYNPASMAPTPIGQYQYDSAALNSANRNAAMGGLFGLGQAATLGAMRWSDRRLKRDIKDIGVRLMSGIKLYAYRMAGDLQIGVMADEVLKVRPQAVHNVGGYLAVDYGAL
jgi:hypothetical protein